MRWKRARKSQNVEDRRGRGPGRRMPGGGGGGMKIGGGAGIIILLIGLFFGVDMNALLGGGGGAPQLGPQLGQQQSGSSTIRDDDEAGQFIARILGTTEDVWGPLFQQSGQQYQAPKLVMFSDSVNSACGLRPLLQVLFIAPVTPRSILIYRFFVNYKKWVLAVILRKLMY